MYRNSSGYPAPTEGYVYAKLMREYRQKQREIYRRNEEIKHRPRVYIVSKYAGDVEKNVAAAIGYCRTAIQRKRIPIASHLLYPAILDDNDPAQRELGLLFGHVLLGMCDEVWVCGTDYSPGMQAEIHEAKRLKKQIVYYNERMEQLHEDDR